MNVIIKQEEVKDYEFTEKVVELAFANSEHSDKSVHYLVARIRVVQYPSAFFEEEDDF